MIADDLAAAALALTVLTALGEYVIEEHLKAWPSARSSGRWTLPVRSL